MINPFKKSYNKRDLELFNFLGEINLFEKLNHEEMSLFIPYLYVREYKKDEVVFFRGDPSNALYLIKNGKVALSLDIKDRTETLTICKKQEAFGDNAMIDEANRIYNAICDSERAELYVLPKVNILEIFESHQKIKGKMLMSLAENYNAITSNLFKSYRSSFGFFNLAQVFLHHQKEEENDFNI